jgi:hypothetical protein
MPGDHSLDVLLVVFIEDLPKLVRLTENALEPIPHRGVPHATDDFGDRRQDSFCDLGGLGFKRPSGSLRNVAACTDEGLEEAFDAAEIGNGLLQSNAGLSHLPLPVPEDRGNAYDGGRQDWDQQQRVHPTTQV